MKLTPDQLSEMIPTNREAPAWCDELNKAFPKYDINTPQRIAGFVSQCAHESGDFLQLRENLNYSQQSLERVFPRYFGPGKRKAVEYARNPEKLANYVYMDEFRTSKLGNTQPGDGAKFIGRGLKQLTGRENYTRFAKDYGMTAEQAAEWLETKEGALASALWFWNTNNLNPIADTGNVVALTKKINGGDNGLADRQARYNKAMAVLTGDTPTALHSAPETIRRGSGGDMVKRVQAALGLTVDGSFGPATEAAVKAWQQKVGLSPDGVLSAQSMQKLFGT